MSSDSTLSSPKEEARDEDLSQSHGAKLGIEAWSPSRMTELRGEHRENKQGRRHEATETFDLQTEGALWGTQSEQATQKS